MYNFYLLIVITSGLLSSAACARDFMFSPQRVGQKPFYLTKESFEREKIGANERSGVWGETPLIIAASNGDWHLVQYLIDAGADVNLQDENGRTPLFAASWHKHPRVAEILIKAGANPNRPTEGGLTPLMASAWRLDQRTVALLLQAGANPLTKDNAGETALNMLESRKAMVDANYRAIKDALTSTVMVPSGKR